MKPSEEMWFAIADAANNGIEYMQLGDLVESVDESQTPCWATTGRFAVYLAPVGKTNWDFKIFTESAHAHTAR